jgi:ABC-type nitrate/sulfonate/bicarbonate transport system substrate-binding protein
MGFCRTLALVASIAALSSSPLQAQETSERFLPEVKVNVFPGGFDWPIYVGRAQRFFSQEGIRVALQDTTGSVAQMTDLSTGKADIAMTAADNIVAYVEGEGEAPIGPQPDFVAVMGSDSSFLSLVAAPAIKTYDGLRGKKISVDAKTTGFAFVLYEMLARKGLNRGDYTVEPAGGMAQRWTALEQQRQAATLLSTPFDIIARKLSFHQIDLATDVIGPYQGIVAGTRRSWASRHRTQVIAFIRAYARSVQWLYQRNNRNEAIAILRQNVPAMSAEMAAQTYRELLNPQRGFFPNAQMDMAGLRTVLALRSRYALPHRVLDDPLKYYDSTYYDAAMRTPLDTAAVGREAR